MSRHRLARRRAFAQPQSRLRLRTPSPGHVWHDRRQDMLDAGGVVCQWGGGGDFSLPALTTEDRPNFTLRTN